MDDYKPKMREDKRERESVILDGRRQKEQEARETAHKEEEWARERNKIRREREKDVQGDV